MTGAGRTTPCRSCGAPVVWGTLNGKPHPLNPRVLTVVTDDGACVRGRESHFATCPHGKQWRTRDGHQDSQG